jgi:hypothetical protein
MIKRVLYILLIFMVISLVALWFYTGGVGKITNAAKSLGNPLNGDNYTIHLPWEPAKLSIGADVSKYVTDNSSPDTPNAEEIQSQADDLQNKINQAKTFGDPSPDKGKVRISDRESPDGGTSAEEYIVLSADNLGTGPVLLSGWSLQSVLTGRRAALPPASSLFILGVVNPVTSVSLNPGQTAIVSTGASPVGVSFRENSCSGYLSQFQTFNPDLDQSCPDPKSAIPETPENLQRYGASCFTYIESVNSCKFPGSILPPDLSVACRSFITTTYTYNGCVNMYQFRTDFRKDQWRLFLQSSQPLWNETHDIIRLLDGEGRTVDVLKY